MIVIRFFPPLFHELVIDFSDRVIVTDVTTTLNKQQGSYQ